MEQQPKKQIGREKLFRIDQRLMFETFDGRTKR